MRSTTLPTRRWRQKMNWPGSWTFVDTWTGCEVGVIARWGDGWMARSWKPVPGYKELHRTRADAGRAFRRWLAEQSALEDA